MLEKLNILLSSQAYYFSWIIAIIFIGIGLVYASLNWNLLWLDYVKKEHRPSPLVLVPGVFY